jgi:GR25 family glycosyltransferase involved in LPS biosynthesis
MLVARPNNPASLNTMSGPIKNTSGIIDGTFPYQVCINLDRRRQRWRQMQTKFARHAIHSVCRFTAIDGNEIELPKDWAHTPGAYGCLRSHVEVVRKARDHGVSSVLIFEDDVAFDEDFETKFAAGIADLPRDWDMLYFGALHKEEPIRISENLARITQANSTFACALRNTVFDAFIELNRSTKEVLDNNSLVLQQKFNCYCFMPHLAWVETDVSDAQQRLMDHWYLRESLVVFGGEVDRLLNETTIVFAHGNHAGAEDAMANLMYLVQYYHHYFWPNVAIVIVEQGLRPSVDTARLPTNCEYIFLQSDGSFNSELCFATGIRHAEPSRRRFILTDNDVYLETLHIRANLRMCERYDYVSGFDKIIDLDRDDSIRLRAAKTPQGLEFAKNRSSHNGRKSLCLFLNREVIEGAGQRDDNLESRLSLLISELRNADRAFHSPNHALRLH